VAKDTYVQTYDWVEDNVLFGYTMLELNNATKDVEWKWAKSPTELVLDTRNEEMVAVPFSGTSNDA
jgi:hypothetical protein